MRKFWVYDLPQWDAIDMTSLLKFQFLFFSVRNPFQFSLAIYSVWVLDCQWLLLNLGQDYSRICVVFPFVLHSVDVKVLFLI